MILYGHGTPPQDEVAHRNYFLDKTDGVSIECGAAGGGIATHLFADLGWECYFIEASKYAFTSLRNYLTVDNANLFNIALSNMVGSAIFKDIIVAPGGGNDNGSLQHTEKHMKELEGYGCVFDEYEVLTTTYSLFTETTVAKPVDLLVLDVEGFEVQVIEGMRDSISLPKVICVEYPISGFNNIYVALTSLGYKYNFTSCNNAFYSFIEKESWFGETERVQDI